MKHGPISILKSLYKSTLRHWYRYVFFIRDFLSFNRLQKGNRFPIHWSDRYPCLDDQTPNTEFDAHYIYHPAWAARILAETKPALHIDISSALAFSTLVSAFMPVEFYDYRPADLRLDNLVSKKADLLHLPFENNSIASLSCMHVVEHIGLGRYGDPLDPDGDLKAIAELKRVLAPGGNLLFVTPVGRPRIQFNAHRVYTCEQIIQPFEGLSLRQFALVNDENQFIIDADPAYANRQTYGCGCWWFVKQTAAG